MKKLLTAVVLGAMLTAVPAVQAESARAKAAVIEFSPGANAADMSAETKRQLQASIAFALTKSRSFDIVDVRHTRAASKSTLAEVNDNASTAAAVKVGRKLGVAYVLTGTVTDYITTGADGLGHATLQTRLIEVATGEVKYAGEIAQKGTSPMRTTGAAEMQLKVLNPAIEKLTEVLGASL